MLYSKETKRGRLITAGLASAALTALTLLVTAGVSTATDSPAATAEEAQAADPTGTTQALVIGTMAFLAMVAAAGAVLWYVARGRTRKTSQ